MMWPQASRLTDITLLLTTQEDFERHARFEYRWSIWPRRCYRSDRRVWGLAVRAEAVWTGPGEPVIEQRWLHRDEGLIMMLKRKNDGAV